MRVLTADPICRYILNISARWQIRSDVFVSIFRTLFYQINLYQSRQTVEFRTCVLAILACSEYSLRALYNARGPVSCLSLVYYFILRNAKWSGKKIRSKTNIKHCDLTVVVSAGAYRYLPDHFTDPNFCRYSEYRRRSDADPIIGRSLIKIQIIPWRYIYLGN